MYTNNIIISQEFFKETALFKKLGNLSHDLRTYFKAGKGDSFNHKDLAPIPDRRKMERVLKDKLYTDLSSTNVFVPIGLYTTYEHYLDTLVEAVSVTEHLLPNVLTPLTRYLALCLTDPSQLKSISGSGIKGFKPNNVDKQLQALEACFKKDSEHGTIPYKVAFERNADVVTVYNKANTVVERFITVNHKEIERKMNEASDLLDNLVRRLEEDDSHQASDATIDILEKVSYTAAQEIEFYGLIAYQVEAMSVALANTSVRLESKSR